MPIHRLVITEFLEAAHQKLLLDVRSPAEYQHAHIPGAINLPLFSDEERKEVGTAYKQVSREAAIKIGLNYFGPRMRQIVEEVEALAGEGREVCIYCWRGGMRSGAIAWLLDLYGFRVTTLAGGYKSFRNLVLKSFQFPFKMKLLGGYTGSGKTLVLRRMVADGKAVLDLEALASHKGSAFGNIGMPPQPVQEMFENMLSTELVRLSGLKFHDWAEAPEEEKGNFFWVEDESQRIGDLNIPIVLWNRMRSMPLFFLEVDFEQRLDHIMEEYGSLDRERISNAVKRISKRLGPLETRDCLSFLENDDIRSAFRILLRYYDKRYKKGLHNRTHLEKILTILPCREVAETNAALLETQYQPL